MREASLSRLGPGLLRPGGVLTLNQLPTPHPSRAPEIEGSRHRLLSPGAWLVHRSLQRTQEGVLVLEEGRGMASLGLFEPQKAVSITDSILTLTVPPVLSLT